MRLAVVYTARTARLPVVRTHVRVSHTQATSLWHPAVAGSRSSNDSVLERTPHDNACMCSATFMEQWSETPPIHKDHSRVTMHGRVNVLLKAMPNTSCKSQLNTYSSSALCIDDIDHGTHSSATMIGIDANVPPCARYYYIPLLLYELPPCHCFRHNGPPKHPRGPHGVF